MLSFTIPTLGPKFQDCDGDGRTWQTAAQHDDDRVPGEVVGLPGRRGRIRENSSSGFRPSSLGRGFPDSGWIGPFKRGIQK